MPKHWRKREVAVGFAVLLMVWAAALLGAIDAGRAASLWSA
jgi:hypothetical protein